MTLPAPKGTAWAFGEVLTSTQMNSIRDSIPKAIDGDAGGTYNPSAPIILGGSGLRVGGSSSTVAVRLSALESFAVATVGTAASGVFALTSVEASGVTVNEANDRFEFTSTGFYEVHLCMRTNSATDHWVAVVFSGADAVTTGKAQPFTEQFNQLALCTIVEVTNTGTDYIELQSDVATCAVVSGSGKLTVRRVA